MSSFKKNFLDLQFSDDFVRNLPGDPNRDISSRLVENACYSSVDPTPVSRPRLIAWSSPLAAQLGINDPSDAERDQVAHVLAGNRLLPGMKPYAARYGGHQFGHWAGQLGDGRAMTLGEIKDSLGRPWDLQLKGAGPTPYSRRADGRAVLRSSLREFLCSESMHHLGIPTTRALSLTLTGDTVVRDMFYDGNPEEEPGAITCRVAPSFLRFGNYQILADNGEFDLLKKLADFAIERFFPEFNHDDPDVYGVWFEEICSRTAKLISEWQRVGFVHGVMNTDNMSILGLTIDYGPYGWLEGFDPMWTPNTTDAYGRRYCYGRQPQIGYWNLQRLGESLSFLFGEKRVAEIVSRGLTTYESIFVSEYRQILANKLGLRTLIDRNDYELAQNFLDLLQSVETDMTIAFRRLGAIELKSVDSFDWKSLSPFEDAFYNRDQVTPAVEFQWMDWFKRYKQRVASDSLTAPERISIMQMANPNFVLRNYLAQEAIDEIVEKGSSAKLDILLSVLQRPYDDWTDHRDLLAKRPGWARNRPGCSALSCSS